MTRHPATPITITRKCTKCNGVYGAAYHDQCPFCGHPYYETITL